MHHILQNLTARVMRPLHEREARTAAASWHEHRERLSRDFLDRATTAGKPRGLRWSTCDWTGAVRLARERDTGLLTAFAGLVVAFEPIEGGEMEGVEAAGMPRAAAAVFHYRHGRWGTGGRTLFNMTPDDAIERLADQFEPIDTALTR